MDDSFRALPLSSAAADVDACPAPAVTSSSTSSSASCPAYAARVSRTCVHPPTLLRIRDPDSPPGSATSASLLQFSLHTAPPSIRRELQAVLPALGPSEPVLLMPTFQPSRVSLTAVTAQSESEKDRLLESFAGFARALCRDLLARGYFADYVDPCTGLPALSAGGGAAYSEVDGASALLRYRVEQAGSCGVVLHPTWGSACYPATCVTNARAEAVLDALRRVRRRWDAPDEDAQRPGSAGGEQQQTRAGGGGGTEDSADESSGARRDEQAAAVQSGKVLEEKQSMTAAAGDSQRIITNATVAFDASR